MQTLPESRDHAVLCLRCLRKTWNLEAICDRCQEAQQ